ncbi:hypothetical protein P9578_25495 [Brevibacillus choshinensis]|uniref:hypothetical protein n=1 Tax=Brevibacillus choshinensis TaxID=54911 RepID=UPI002E1BCE40|nr:hypothetical protein [Brevibacillus choshinensis]
MFRFSICILLVVSCWLSGSKVYAEPETSPKREQATIVDSFLAGLRVETPKQVVELWILGVKNRSGAVQYATLSPNLQQKTRKQFEKRSWGTGQSSPWVDNVRFVKEEKISDTEAKYTIEYELLTSEGKYGKGQKVVTVKKNPEPFRKNWFITKITTNYNEFEAFTPAETVIR